MVESPYLIQRAEINTPIARLNDRLSKAVNFDYMGSSEFEFGALPESFRRIEANADKFVMRKVPEIMEDGASLRVWSYLTDEEFEEYKGYLLRLRNEKLGRVNTKERTDFDQSNAFTSKYRYSKTDFWWDITNDTMFGFKKEFMNRVGNYVANSLTYMNEQKQKREGQ